MAGRSPRLEEQPRDVADHGRLAAAADAEVADADDRARQPSIDATGARVPPPPPDRDRAVHRAEGVNQCTSRKGRTTPPGRRARRRQEVGDDRERLVLRAAIGLDQRPRRRAEPRAPHRIGHQRQQRLVELAFGLHLHRRAVGDEGVGDLLEVLHVRAEDDRLAEHRRLQDVVSALVDQAPADEHRRRHLIELRQLAERVEHDDVGARLGVDRQLGTPRGRRTRPRATAARLRRTARPAAARQSPARSASSS